MPQLEREKNDRRHRRGRTPSSVGARERRENYALEVLRFEFSRRAQKNPQYSQRSFAKFLGVSHTLLSLILNGRRAPSKALVERLCERCRLSPRQIGLLLRSTTGLESSGEASGAGGASTFNKISLDQFALISEWQHYAILSLLEIPDTELTPEFVSQRLGISPLLAKVSIQRLIHLGVIEKAEGGKWRQKPGPIVVENVKSTVWTRKFQAQLLGKAVESLHGDPIELRDFSSTTLAVHPRHLPFALQRIREFRRQLTRELESFGDPEEVYNLTVQFFPTSRRSKK